MKTGSEENYLLLRKQ